MTIDHNRPLTNGRRPGDQRNGRDIKDEPVIEGGRVGAEDMLRQFGRNVYQEAYEHGMSVSAWLEHEDPSTPDELREGMDAFSRVIRCANIRTKSVPEWGVYADEFGAFDESDQTRALVPEFMARLWRRAATGQPMHRVVHQTADMPLGAVGNPFGDVARPRPTIQPAITLGSLVAQTTNIDSDAYRAFYLIPEPVDELRMVRIAETAEVPRAKLTSGDATIRLHKYGRALEASYETLRRQSIDKIAFYIQWLAVQAEVDKVLTVLDVLINGDGNPNTAAQSFNLTTLDPSTTANNLTLRGWLAFKMKFANPYQIQAALAQDVQALGLMLLNTGSANIPLVTLPGGAGFGSFRPINQTLGDAVGLGWMAEAPSGKVIGSDTRFAVERVTEVGSQIREVDRWVTRQTQVLVMTEVEGYAILDANATKILNVAA